MFEIGKAEDNKVTKRRFHIFRLGLSQRLGLSAIHSAMDAVIRSAFWIV